MPQRPDISSLIFRPVVIGKDDVERAIEAARVSADAAGVPPAAEALTAATSAFMHRLVQGGTAATRQIGRDLLCGSILETLGATVLPSDDADLALVPRAKGVRRPVTFLRGSLTGAAMAAGFADAEQTLDDVLTRVADLRAWACAAKSAFDSGRDARQKYHPDPPIAAASRDFGLVAIWEFARLTGRPPGFSRRSTAAARALGEVSGPLPRFLQSLFAALREKMSRDKTLAAHVTAPALQPQPETIADWIIRARRDT
jgi:hypothetical protein